MTRPRTNAIPLADRLVLTPAAAGELLSLSEMTVRRLIRNGDLGHVSTPRGLGISRAQVAEYVERLESEAAHLTENRKRLVARRKRPA